MSDDTLATFLEKVERRDVSVAVVGLGYVGLPLALAFAERGVRVLGLERDPSKAERVNAGSSYIGDVADEALARVVAAGTFTATTDPSVLAEADVISICVPTPLSKIRDPDLSAVRAVAEELAGRLRRGQLVVLESTTYPGTTEEMLLPMLARGGFEVGRDFFLAFSPERVDPGRRDFTVSNTPRVVGGMTEACTKAACAFYGIAIERLVPVSSPRAAEMAKLLENTFRTVNVALVNEVALMCDRLGVQVFEVIDAAATKPFGFMPFYPGPGLGGHCLPIDPLYLSWKMRTLDYKARFIELAEEVNRSMPQHVVQRVFEALNDLGKSVRGARVLVLGVAYKRDVSDVRESPAFDVLRQLARLGAELSFHDPHVDRFEFDGVRLSSSPLDEELLRSVDCAVVVTDHSGVDYGRVVGTVPVVVDARNATRDVRHLGRVVTI